MKSKIGDVSVHEKKIAGLEKEIEALETENSDLRGQIQDLEDKLESMPELERPVQTFLDCCNRPVGRLNFTVEQGAHVDRAILALFDAVERNP